MKTKEELEQLAWKFYVDKDGIVPNTYESEGFTNGYAQCQKDDTDNSKVTRFEVIDDNGRVYTTKDCKVELSYQDDGRTLKVFINSLNK